MEALREHGFASLSSLDKYVIQLNVGPTYTQINYKGKQFSNLTNFVSPENKHTNQWKDKDFDVDQEFGIDKK